MVVVMSENEWFWRSPCIEWQRSSTNADLIVGVVVPLPVLLAIMDA